MKIGLDWAGVVADVNEARRQLLMEMYGHLQLEDGTLIPFDRNLGHAVKDVKVGRCPIFMFSKEWVLTPKEDEELLSITLAMYERMKVELYGSETRMRNIPEVPGAIEAIAKLREEGHDVTIVTSRGRHPMQQSGIKWWLDANKLEIPVIFNAKDKTGMLKDYDLFIDDKKRQLVPAQKMSTIRLLFAHCYNIQDTTDFIYAENCGYIGDWPGILRWIAAR